MKFVLLLLLFIAPRSVRGQGAYRGSEIISKQQYFWTRGQELRVRWRAKAATGNCVITLFSLFNGDLLFDRSKPESARPRWSEITFETFGGSSNNRNKQFQTQYITQANDNDPPTQRGKQHVWKHYKNGAKDLPNIFSDKFRTYEIRFTPKGNGKNAKIVWFLDGQEIRTVVGGDANFLEPPLDIYAGVWITTAGSNWGCTGGGSPRPNESQAKVDWITVDKKVGSKWQRERTWDMNNNGEVSNKWDKSNWGFDGFDGTFDPDSMNVGNGKLNLQLKRR